VRVDVVGMQLLGLFAPAEQQTVSLTPGAGSGKDCRAIPATEST
jgi:hypothetical protein